MATILIPAIIYGLMIVGQRVPATERVASGVSAGEMFREAIRPMFLLWASCIVLTAATELLSVMGAIGNIAVYLALPLMGRIYDRYGAAQSFRYVTEAPLVLVFVFGVMFLYYKAHGGYRAVRIERGTKPGQTDRSVMAG
jgi:Na+/pantothenate symporter